MTLSMYAVADPMDIVDRDIEGSIVTTIQYILQELFEFYRKTVIDLHKVRMFLEVTKLK